MCNPLTVNKRKGQTTPARDRKPYIDEGILPKAAGPYFYEEIFTFTVKSPLHLNVRE
jgi:hypothetical protein